MLPLPKGTVHLASGQASWQFDDQRCDRVINLIGACLGLGRGRHQSLMVKKSRKAKLWIYQPIYIPILTFGPGLRAVTKNSLDTSDWNK